MSAPFLPAATVFAALAISSQAQAGPLDPWTEKGWTVLFEAKGDLNGDGVEDYAAIIEAPEGENQPENACEGEEGYSEAPTRRLVIALDEAGTLKVAADEPRVILRRDEGGVFGDPLEGLGIERGAVVISHYGGSRWRWGNTLRFRLDDGEWRLIGLTDFSLDSAYGNIIEYDYNALSGKMKLSVEIGQDNEEPVCVACRTGEDCPEQNGCYAGSRAAKAGATWFKIGPKPSVTLAGFRCWQDKTGLLRHLGFQTLQ